MGIIVAKYIYKIFANQCILANFAEIHLAYDTR